MKSPSPSEAGTAVTAAPTVDDSTAHHGLEQTVFPSPRVITLDPDPRDCYQSRLGDAAPTASELYQANARLRPWEADRIPSSADEQAVRRWFLESGRAFAAPNAGGPWPQRPFDDLTAPLAALCARLAEEGGAQGGLLYVVDLEIVLDGWLWLVPPGGQELVAERRVDETRSRRLAGAVPEAQRALVADAEAVFTVTTVPWRLQVLHGERGYRRALLETGITVSRICSLAAGAGWTTAAVVDFIDTTVDDCLFNDGIERFCTALVPLADPPASRQEQR